MAREKRRLTGLRGGQSQTSNYPIWHLLVLGGEIVWQTITTYLLIT
mgnify:FL=1